MTSVFGKNNSNPVDFKTHLLYILPNDKNCRLPLQLAASVHSILIQNVAEFQPGQRPEWLNGVPTVVDIKNKVAYKGTEALQLLHYLHQEHNKLSSPGMALPVTAQPAQHEPTFSNLQSSNHHMNFVGSVDPNDFDTSKYKQSGRVRSDQIQKYNEARSRVPAPVKSNGVTNF